ncbi:MAG: phenylacetate-CoA oxygenase subunit PaaJ [Burkholderiales bacterium]|jgi:ring-1,2-phenylacetyl-CoA epoxidase subunit PaaD|nr:phenylacetate-CoA oxygenase subunit PaaJ [Burkholderiales bacterium]
MQAPATANVRPPVEAVWSWLADVPDPEIPAVSVVDLGIVRDVRWDESGELVVTVTPTYSGCPATELIAAEISSAIRGRGIGRVRLETRLSPAWTTDWITDRGRERLSGYGIAPPGYKVIDASAILRRRAPETIACPRCGSTRTSLTSRFGSTPCKALYRCEACLEPFDYFKPH